mmetsp:Transcript_55747/g.92222  ORF Transcript_55747/g.92222 Transcript_55747/m.92222 type:complete len:201 (-) Transcript_55747:75-677(-)|eukprot:CAMPEP_0119305240 /NCGR_PEP_ID=MMETSP1333-20130426/6287_1 /TAXON_ID=418940 /ORGANISM="Scyphosphaera apsteinii, Strain RCC1455" /LENGTH=200 /DNA_ID=CAMNT_0007308285 /DNA_START=89 /DNA_END=691 /DNA_ORIENTATION=+
MAPQERSQMRSMCELELRACYHTTQQLESRPEGDLQRLVVQAQSVCSSAVCVGNTALHLAARSFRSALRTEDAIKAQQSGSTNKLPELVKPPVAEKKSKPTPKEEPPSLPLVPPPEVIGPTLRLLDSKADPNLSNALGLAPPKWTREVTHKMQVSGLPAMQLLEYARERALLECDEIDALEKEANSKGKKKKGGKGKKKK